MAWESINVGEVEIDNSGGSGGNKEPVPAGTYILQLTGAYENKFRPTDTDVQFTITDEGPFQGRKVYLELPDPDRMTWAPQAYRRIVEALGADVTPFGHPKEELTKLSQNGHSRLTADVYIETFKRKDGTAGAKNRIKGKSLRPAA